jgi:hypothetical protein
MEPEGSLPCSQEPRTDTLTNKKVVFLTDFVFRNKYSAANWLVILFSDF